MYILASKFCFLEFRLLLSRVAPYYSLLPRTVGPIKLNIYAIIFEIRKDRTLEYQHFYPHDYSGKRYLLLVDNN